jgi:hypothetical protein
MSLVSVDKAISGQDFDSPDFKKLTWKADDTCTLKILKTNGTFMLDASVKYWSWTKSARSSQAALTTNDCIWFIDCQQRNHCSGAQHMGLDVPQGGVHEVRQRGLHGS